MNYVFPMEEERALRRNIPSDDVLVGQSPDAHLCDLIHRVTTRDESAMAFLYRAISRKVYAYSLRRLGDNSDAEDVVVETMFEVWKHAARFRGESKVGTWVLGIARHKTLDYLRARNGESCESLEEDAEAMLDDSPDAYERLLSKQRYEKVVRDLHILPEKQRECVHLAFFEEMPLAEIAHLQGCPENTVKTRIFHGRRKLKELQSPDTKQ